ncbi:hypothetical protein LCGC14_0768620 [marine sediment metagenome]|uniref:Uncharacterized protein n=1 Tax=marine sediment metagenome TaxID=412755 RepID=A0A0F9Q371_9ZZZZ
MNIRLEPCVKRDLRPGDLFSSVGPNYWDHRDLNSIGERVYIRTDAPARADDLDTEVYRVLVEIT